MENSIHRITWFVGIVLLEMIAQRKLVGVVHRHSIARLMDSITLLIMAKSWAHLETMYMYMFSARSEHWFASRHKRINAKKNQQ